MKKLLIFTAIIFAVLSFQSCGTYYEYIQLLSTKPVDQNAPITKTNGGILYEDEDCAIFYKFWNEGGNPGFEFYNKTDKIIYIDLSKTFFIKNGIAYDYFTQQTITNTKTTSSSTTATQSYGLSATRPYSNNISPYINNFGNVPQKTLKSIVSSTTATSPNLKFSAIGVTSTSQTSTIGHSSSIATTNNHILSVPPKTSKFIYNFSITANEIIDCGLEYYPEKTSQIEYNAENSPITFSNYITFKIGEDTTLKSIENSFYVNKIANYAKQEVINYVKREKICDNILTPRERDEQKTREDIYDLYINVGDESTFYITYKIYSSSKLYDEKIDNYIWNEQYKGYIKY